MSLRAKSENVSPTAYATGYFWYRHGLSHPALLIREGRRADRGFRWIIRGVRALGGVSLDALMLARHQGIDALLTRAIESGRVSQVIELAAGLSPRGWRYTQRYGARIDYVETDLPQMAALKQELLSQGKLLGPRHRVATVDVLRDDGPGSLKELGKSLDPKAGTAIVTEGLMSYLDPEAARGVWRRIAEFLRGFPYGVYFSDAYVRSDRYGLGLLLFGAAIQYFVRGRMYVHFAREAEGLATLRACGFRQARLHLPRDLPETAEVGAVPGGDRVRILEALA